MRTGPPALSTASPCRWVATGAQAGTWLQDACDDRVSEAGGGLALRVACAPCAPLVLFQGRRQRRPAERAGGAGHAAAQPRLEVLPRGRGRARRARRRRPDAATLKQPLHRAQPGDLFVVRAERGERSLHGPEGLREVARVEVRLDEAVPRAAIPGVNLSGFGGLRRRAVPVAAADVDQRGVCVRECMRLDLRRLLIVLERDLTIARLIRAVPCTTHPNHDTRALHAARAGGVKTLGESGTRSVRGNHNLAPSPRHINPDCGLRIGCRDHLEENCRPSAADA